MCDSCEFAGYLPGSALIVPAHRVPGLLRSASTRSTFRAQTEARKSTSLTQRVGDTTAVVALCTWIVVGLSLVVSASRWFPGDASYSIALGSFACVLVTAGLTRNTTFSAPQVRAIAPFVAHAIIGCLVFLALTAILFDRARSPISLVLIATLYVPAFAEEWIFRVALPRRITTILADNNRDQSEPVFISL